MPVIRSTEPITHELHGARFHSYATGATGSTELRSWRLELPAGVEGVEHTVSREEVFLVLSGAPRLSLDGEAAVLAAGDVAVAPAGSRLRIATGDTPATVWVTTSAGLTATLPDGTVISPPWAA
ncbi:cupin domain-containing protein [Kitasatospora sp. NPDC048540]|uniref:cupin domain-containing protein n=1 Tax=unclassified Kitasatospora TaxID=2633591 RepID=UPI000539BE22|nr:cupin domain-containing protein [Kitasatospora sp. MBT63]